MLRLFFYSLVLNFIVDTLLVNVDTGDLYDLRAFLVIGQYAFYLMFVTYLLTKNRFYFRPAESVIIVIAVYFLVLSLFSSDKIVTYNFLAKYFIGLSGYFIGYSLLGNKSNFNSFVSNLWVLNVVFIGFILGANVFGLGRTAYRGQLLLIGNLGVETMFTFALIITLAPFIIRLIPDRNKRIKYIASSIVSLLLLLFIFRRTNLLIISIGWLVGFLANNKIKSIATYSLILLMVVIVTVTIDVPFLDEIGKNFQKRILDKNILQEGRVIENEMALESIRTSTGQLLFGTGELFNSARKYGFQYSEDETLYNRPLHNDYARLLFGSGITGLILNLILILIMYRGIHRGRKYKSLKPYYLLGVTLIIVLIVTGLSSGMTNINYRYFIFSALGGISGIISNRAKEIRALSMI